MDREIPLRVGRLRRCVRDPRGRGRLPQHPEHSHRPAARRVRVEPRHRRHRRQHQRDSLRAGRSVRRRSADQIRTASRHDDVTRRHLGGCVRHHPDDPSVAVVPAVGCGRGDGFGVHGHGLCLHGCVAVVREEPRHRHRNAHGGKRQRPVDLPSRPHAARGSSRLAHRRHCHSLQCARGRAGRLPLPPQLTRRHRPRSARRTGRVRDAVIHREPGEKRVRCAA